jgi:ribonuclease R
MEQKAVEAERESVKYKQVEYMKDKVGQEFAGIISGVVSFGIFVELIDSRCEGLVDIDTLTHDFFVYNETNHALVGSDTGLVYRLGDNVRVKVIKADLERRRLDYELTEPL